MRGAARALGQVLRGPGVAFLLVSSTSAAGQAQAPSERCCAQFDYILERTIFKVDAVRLELTVGSETADPVSELVHGRVDPRSEEEGVARLYVNAEEAEVRMTFLRSFSLKRFLDANREQMEGLAEAGLLTDREIRRLIAENEERFAVLEGDGIRDGDRLEHEVRGDTVTTRYTDVTGAIRIDEVQVGAEQRTMLMGSLFGPQSSFRNGLLDLVFSRSLSTP